MYNSAAMEEQKHISYPEQQQKRVFIKEWLPVKWIKKSSTSSILLALRGNLNETKRVQRVFDAVQLTVLHSELRYLPLDLL